MLLINKYIKTMQKIKNNSLFVISLIVTIAVFFSLTFFVIAKNEISAEKSIKSQFGKLNAQEHRSTVANFVQALLETATKPRDGIGQQVRVIAQQQNDSDTTTTKAFEKVQSRSKIKTFLIGSDYRNLGALRSEMVKTKNRIGQLNRLIENATNMVEIQTQIQTLEQEQTKIENFVKEQENRFSLFGWLVKLFTR